MRRGADCSHTLKALLGPDMRRSGGKGRSKGSRSISWMEYLTLWGGVSVTLTLRLYQRESSQKRGNRAQGMVGAICKTCGKEMKAWGGHRIFSFRLLRRSDGHERTAFQAREWECPAPRLNERRRRKIEPASNRRPPYQTRPTAAKFKSSHKGLNPASTKPKTSQYPSAPSEQVGRRQVPAVGFPPTARAMGWI